MGASEGSQGRGGRARILLVDDHPMIRSGLAHQVGKEPDVEVCGGTGSGRAALELASALLPDAAVVDLALPDMDGVDLIKDLASRHPRMAILVFSMRDERLYAERVLRAGARGYIMKGETPDTVMAALRRVMAGEVYLSPDMAHVLLSRLVGGEPAKDPSPIESLSDRELQVLTMMGEGLGPRQIGEALHLSARTIETYRARIKAKLGVEDAAGLRQFAVQWMRKREQELLKR